MAGCVPAPVPPPSAPSDWEEAVHANCLTNIQRLGLWTGGSKPIGHGVDPSAYFATPPVGSLPTKPDANVYVIVHGWAPGWKDIANKNPGLQWWSPNAKLQGLWPSDWAWANMSTTSPAFPVSDTGMIQQIIRHDPTATVVCYSWIDDSATGDLISDWVNPTKVYQSEAYTQVNGLRLADAIRRATRASFWSSSGNLHIIGHSHGSKVAAVAALALQKSGYPADRLTVLDAPETWLTKQYNGENLLGYHLSKLPIVYSQPTANSIFVDNYPSCFGVAYAGNSSLNEIADVVLNPTVCYGVTDLAGQHAYSGGWYAAVANSSGQNGLDWPPAPAWAQGGANQEWRGQPNQNNQWLIAPGVPQGNGTYTFGAVGTPITGVYTTKGVSFTQSNGGTLVMNAGQAAGTPMWFYGQFGIPLDSSTFGISANLTWQNARSGDYVVLTVSAPKEPWTQEVIAVFDGATFGGNLADFPINFPSDTWNPWVYVYFIPAQGNMSGVVTLSAFAGITVQTPSGEDIQRESPRTGPGTRP